MLVMKFGGASVKDADAIRNVSKIIDHHSSEPLLVVISASGKTTNHLEELAALAKKGDELGATQKLASIKDFHNKLVHDLFEDKAPILAKTAAWYREIERIVHGILLLEEFPARTYDRIVAYGELLSTTIVEGYMQTLGAPCKWLDARTVVKTDAIYQQANVIWSLTKQHIQEQVKPIVLDGQVLITQGFIGSTPEGKTTTLGREGSDYSAAIFAHCLEADRMMVWKDVIGILNGDPRRMPDAVKINELSYEEAVEMTFYGATVIHPKTIKPIFNKQIPLYVKCFRDINETGSCISENSNPDPIPSYIVKENQVLFEITPKDFSFMDEQHMREVFDRTYKSGIKLNLIQNSAISLLLCTDHHPQRTQAFEALLLDNYEVKVFSDLQLHTVLNFQEADTASAKGARLVQQFGNKLFMVK